MHEKSRVFASFALLWMSKASSSWLMHYLYFVRLNSTKSKFERKKRKLHNHHVYFIMKSVLGHWSFRRFILFSSHCMEQLKYFIFKSFVLYTKHFSCDEQLSIRSFFHSSAIRSSNTEKIAFSRIINVIYDVQSHEL